MFSRTRRIHFTFNFLVTHCDTVLSPMNPIHAIAVRSTVTSATPRWLPFYSYLSAVQFDVIQPSTLKYSSLRLTCFVRTRVLYDCLLPCSTHFPSQQFFLYNHLSVIRSHFVLLSHYTAISLNSSLVWLSLSISPPILLLLLLFLSFDLNAFSPTFFSDSHRQGFRSCRTGIICEESCLVGCDALS